MKIEELIFCNGVIFNIHWFRNLFFDFLIGSKGRRNANEIRESAKWQEKLSMKYVKPHIVQHVKAFKWFYALYISYLCSLIPKIALFFYSNGLERNGNPYGIKIATCVNLIDMILSIYLGCVYSARDGSKYRYPEKKMKKR